MVGQAKGQHEGIGHRPRAQHRGQHDITQEPEDPAGQRQA